jgi:hypothetical protein
MSYRRTSRGASRRRLRWRPLAAVSWGLTRRVIAALALAPATLAAQVVSGTVIDAATRRPMGGVAVTVRSARDSVTLRVGVTDTLGQFRLSLPGPDTVFVTARRIGLEPVETPPRPVTANMERQFVFNMSHLPYLLDTVRSQITKELTGRFYKLTTGQEWFSQHYRAGKGFFSSGIEVRLSGLHPCDYLDGLPGFEMSSAILRGVRNIACFNGNVETPPLRYIVAERQTTCIEAYVDRRFHLVAANNNQLGVMMPGYDRIRWIDLQSIHGIEVFTDYDDRPKDFSFVQSPPPMEVLMSGTGFIPAPLSEEAAAMTRARQKRDAPPMRCALILIWTSQLWG